MFDLINEVLPSSGLYLHGGLYLQDSLYSQAIFYTGLTVICNE
jgi:hypothetical protein